MLKGGPPEGRLWRPSGTSVPNMPTIVASLVSLTVVITDRADHTKQAMRLVGDPRSK